MSSMYQRPAFTEEPENQLSAVELFYGLLCFAPGLGI